VATRVDASIADACEDLGVEQKLHAARSKGPRLREP
jgi:hypothetical protein